MKQIKAGRDYVGIGVGIIIPHPRNPERIVLTLRSNKTNNRAGEWELVGGTEELHDTLEETVAKEGNEETKLELKVLGCISIHQDFVEGQHWLSLGYHARIIGGRLQNGEPHKFERVEYHSIYNLPGNVSKLTKEVIAVYRDANMNPAYIPIPIMRS